MCRPLAAGRWGPPAWSGGGPCDRPQLRPSGRSATSQTNVGPQLQMTTAVLSVHLIHSEASTKTPSGRKPAGGDTAGYLLRFQESRSCPDGCAKMSNIGGEAKRGCFVFVLVAVGTRCLVGAPLSYGATSWASPPQRTTASCMLSRLLLAAAASIGPATPWPSKPDALHLHRKVALQ
jgi:hypothetical protein